MTKNLFKNIFLLFFISQFTSCKTKLENDNTMIDSAKIYTNNLINEKSPYLLQHAHNPVNWYPWGEEAFEKAKLENKAIFLSIGYSTCHWCHVMEHESFEDEEIARLMNDTFISIKVDREERPDIDNIYMSVCQMLTGSGGWPLTIIMTPEQKPFFAGTYFPKESKGGRIGMMELIPKIKKAWDDQKEQIYSSADKITEQVNSAIQIGTGESISSNILEKANSDFTSRFDDDFGGFGNKPKFPSPHNLSFLLRYYQNTSNSKSLEMVTKTLTEMRKGGIYDHVGFGFHRYSTDRKWFLPHFEKMLYDQAMLTIAYTEAFQLTKNELFKQTADEILTYVLRDMTSPDGGFYSAEDADSEGEEGKFYLWTKEEIIELLGKEDGELIASTFNVENNGNYFEEASGHQTGTNHFYLRSELTNNKLLDKLSELREILFNEREKRIHPYKDDKILTDWNGLMIAALAKSSRILGSVDYAKAAERSVEFIYSKLIDDSGQLLHRFRDGEAAIHAQIDDYSFLIWGLLELYETTFTPDYLCKAIKLVEHLLNNYWDQENNSGFYFTSNEDSKLISRPKEFYDGAIPSGNSVMYSNLIKLNKLTANPKYLEYGENLGLAFNNFIARSPTGFAQFLTGLQFSFGPSFEIIIVGEKDSEETKEMIETINAQFIPNKVVMLINENDREAILEIAPFAGNYSQIDGKTTVYVCKNYVCSLPTTNKEKIIELLSTK